MDENKKSLVTLLLLALITISEASMGINYGRIGNNLPSPYESIQLVKTTKAGRVKLYDSDPEILKLLSGTKIRVSIMVTNDQISRIASNQAVADQWVRDNVLAYYPDTMIRFILVGNEILSYKTDQDRKVWYDVVPAMRRIKNSLKGNNIRNIKIGTPLAMDIMESTFPPSSGTFRSDLRDPVIIPLLRFLNRTKSFFFLDVYTYFPWSENPTTMSLDFALLKDGNNPYIDPVTRLPYNNLLDQMLDSVVFAMSKLRFQNVMLAISETGWPNAGDSDEPGANTYNAATYNRNLVRRMTAEPPLGTPARPGFDIPTFIFSLYDENLKGGPGTERHWGLFHPNGMPVYELNLTGVRPRGHFCRLPESSNKCWRVSKRNKF